MDFVASIAAPGALGNAATACVADKRKQTESAQNFEGLLISQMLRSVRESGSGWLGTGDDDASSTAFGFGEEQLAVALAKCGGMGLSKVIAEGLEKKEESSQPTCPAERAWATLTRT